MNEMRLSEVNQLLQYHATDKIVSRFLVTGVRKLKLSSFKQKENILVLIRIGDCRDFWLQAWVDPGVLQMCQGSNFSLSLSSFCFVLVLLSGFMC